MIDRVSQSARIKPRNWKVRACAAACGIALVTFSAAPAHCTDGIDIEGGDTVSVEDLPTGAKLLLQNQDAGFEFAGCAVEAAHLTAIAGYAAQLAYLVVIDGVAACGDGRAKAGRMLIFPPYGGKVESVRFDAARFAQGWTQEARNAAPDAFAQLQAIAAKQKLGVTLGRLAPTRFNVAASGSASSERTWRAQLGGQAVRRLRFMPGGEQEAFELQVVSSLLDALSRGDAAAVGELLDPMPFGERSLEAGNDKARLALAQAIVRRHDWRTVAETTPSRESDSVWIAGPAGQRVEIRLRQTRDFAFIQSITDRN